MRLLHVHTQGQTVSRIAGLADREYCDLPPFLLYNLRRRQRRESSVNTAGEQRLSFRPRSKVVFISCMRVLCIKESVHVFKIEIKETQIMKNK